MNKKGALGAALVLIGVMVFVVLLLYIFGPELTQQFRGLDSYLRGIETSDKFCDQIAAEITAKDVSLQDGEQKYTGQTVPKPAACATLAKEMGVPRKGREDQSLESKWAFSKESSAAYGNEYCCLFIVNKETEENPNEE